jgi:hypothetical protein
MQGNVSELTKANPMLCVYYLGRPVRDTGASTMMCGWDRLEVTAMVHHSEAQQQPSRKINLYPLIPCGVLYKVIYVTSQKQLLFTNFINDLPYVFQPCIWSSSVFY